MPTQELRRFEFGAYTLDCASRSLTDERGHPVHLSGQSFDALAYLVQHAGHIVGRAELMTALWPNTVVEDNSLNRVILLLRRSLGDGYIVTIKGRGYQLVADVHIPEGTDDGRQDEVRSKSAVASQWTRVGFVFIAGVAAAGLIAALFILPRDTTSLRPDPQTRFSAVPTDNDRALRYYLSGREYEAMRSDTDRDLVIRQYRRAVDEDPGFALAWARLSIAHNEKYWFREDVSPARQQLSYAAAVRALDLDPDLPEARMALGWYYYHIEQDFGRAMTELERAATLMPEDPEVYWRMGNVLRRYGEIERAIDAFERVSNLGPMEVDYLYAQASLMILLRDYSSAEEMFDRILDLIPDQIASLNDMLMIPLYRDGDAAALEQAAHDARFGRPNAWALPQPVLGWTAAVYGREYELAMDYLDAWNETSWTVDFYFSRDGLFGLTLEFAGRRAESPPHWQAALAQVEGVLEQNPEFPEARMARAEALVRLGRADAGVDEAIRIIAQYEETGDWISAAKHRLDAARRVFVPAGQADLAFEALETYLEGNGMWSIEGLAPDPAFDPIRDDPRFAQLLATYGRH